MILTTSVLTLSSSCSNLLGLNTEILRDIYNSWGPSTCNCLKFAQNPKAIGRHEQDVFRAAFELTKDASNYPSFKVPSATYWIFVVRPSPDSREIASVEFGTNRLREIFVRAYTQQDHAVRYSFYRTIRGHPWFASLAGQIFEIHVLLWFWHTESYRNLSCTYATERTPRLLIPSCQENLKFFYKAEELKDISEPEKPLCLVPTSRTFPSLDAVVLTSNTVITIKITIAFKHSANEEEFDLIYRNLPPGLLQKRPYRNHVFVTDKEINAKSLREQKSLQNLTENPKGIAIFSTAIGVDYLDSTAPATEERVDALEKARVSIYWLYPIWYSLGNM